MEDLTGSIEVIVFPSQVVKFDKLLKQDTLVIVKGNLDIQDESAPKLRLEEIRPFQIGETPEKRKEEVSKIYLQMGSNETEKIAEVKKILRRDIGVLDVFIYFSDLKKVSKAPENMRLRIDDERLTELQSILGAENVRLV